MRPAAGLRALVALLALAAPLALVPAGCGGAPGEWPYTGAGVMDLQAIRTDQKEYVLAVGERRQVRVTPVGYQDAGLQEQPATFTSFGPAVFGVDAEGVLTGRAPGSAILRVDCAGKSLGVTVTVR
jgi:hypothetical protein